MRTARQAILAMVLLRWLLAGCVVPVCAAQEEEGAKPRSPLPQGTYNLIRDLKSPQESGTDALLLIGPEAQRYRASLTQGAPPRGPDVRAYKCDIRGEVSGKLVQLAITVDAVAETDQPTRLPLGLEGTSIKDATVDGQPLRWGRDSQGLVAWIRGKGRHKIKLAAQLQLSGSESLPSLVCNTPEALISSLELTVPRQPSLVRFVPASPVDIKPASDSKYLIRAEALGPRRQIDLRWRWADRSPAPQVPVVTAVSEVIALVERGLVQLRTELRLPVLQGERQRWEITLGPNERVVSEPLTDGTPPDWQMRKEFDRQVVTVTLPEPVKSGSSANVTIRSEIPFSGDTVSFQGLTVSGILSHRADVVVRSALEHDVVATELVYARSILDPTQVPPNLRSPGNVAAFRAFRQPFRLKLVMFPRRTGLTVRTSAAIATQGAQATVFERWEFTVQGGKLPYVDMLLPEPFEVDDLIYSDQVKAVDLMGSSGSRAARVYLDGAPARFELRVRKLVPLVVVGDIAQLDLPRPAAARSAMSRLYVAGDHEQLVRPTGDFEPSLEPLGELAEELPRRPEVFHGYQTSALLERVALQISHGQSRTRYRTAVGLRLDSGLIAVRQSITSTGQGDPLGRLQLESLVLEDAPGVTDAIPPSGIANLRINRATDEPVRVDLSYELALELAQSAGQRQTVRVPLVRPLNGSCDETEVTIMAPSSLQTELQGAQWQPVARSPVRTKTESSDGATPRVFRQFGQPDALMLRVTTLSLAPQPEAIVDRALIETTLETDGVWQCTARYRIVSCTRPRRLRIRPPAGSRITAVSIDRDLVRPTVGPEDAEWIVDLGGRLLPATLGIDYTSTHPSRMGPWISITCHAPVLSGDVSLGQILWRLILPEQFRLLSGPDHYTMENQWRWAGTRVRSEPRMDDAALERWLGGSAASTSDALLRNGQEYLYSRLVSVKPISVLCVRSPWLLLVCSGTVLLVGLVLVTVPMRGKALVILLLAVVGSLAMVWEPASAVECAQAAALGMVLVAISGSVHRWLLRRGRRRRTIFPEAGMLAGSPEATAKSRGEAHLQSPHAPVPPVSGRQAAASSSVK